VYHGLYSEAVVSSIASAVALAEVGQFKKAAQYLQKAVKTLYEAARDVFEHVKVTAQRLVELFVEAVTRVLAWIDEHKAYLFLMAAVAAGIIALSVALDMWGLVELEKLAHAAVGAPLVAGLADTGGKAAERFRALAERYEKWKIDANVVDEILKAPLRGERPYTAFLKMAESRRGLPPPLVELRRSLARVKDEAERDAAVVAALVLYKTLINNAGAYGEWAGWYEWARGLVGRQEFTVAAGDIKRFREAHNGLKGVAGKVLEELNTVLTLYSQSSLYKEKPDFLDKLKLLLEVDVKKTEELAEARSKELSEFEDANMGTKAYAALLSVVRGGLYGHVAMLLMGEGALADMVLLTPKGAYKKAERVANGRGEAVDPSRSGRRERSVGQPGWEDRTTSALLRYLLGRAVSEDLMFRRVEGGFEVFRTYGGVETPVDVLKIEEVARSKTAGEELRRFVEEARREAPDLLGLDKAPQYLAWRATDVSTSGGQIVATTAHIQQAAWYFGLLGEEESSRSRVNVTKKGVKLIATMYWPRERENQILKESRWLESVLGRRVESWRELVDAINWRWVLKRVEEMAGALKPWIGRRKMGDAEREGLARRMLGELELLAHFAEARKGLSDDEWRKERIEKLAEAVKALSGGRIAGDHANGLAGLIINYAKKREERTKKRIKNLADEVGVSKEEVWGVVERVLSGEDPYVYCLAKDCADDRIVRKFVAPALELVMLDKALNNKFDREEALLRFGEMYATAVAGDGHMGRRSVELTVGGELGGGAALLRLATLHMLNQLLPDELKFNVRAYVGEGRYYHIDAYGRDAAWLRRLLAVTAPSAGGKYLSEKFNKLVKEARVEVQSGNIRRTKRNVAADLTISEAGITVKCNVYLSKNTIVLEFHSTNRSRVELAARLLRLAGVGAEVERVGGRDVWRVVATTSKLTAGYEKLREALAKIVREAVARGWVDAGNAEDWLKKLEKRRVLKEGWPKYYVGLSSGGALDVRFGSTNPGAIEREAQRLRDMGLVEGVHFSAKMPEGGKAGYVSVLKEGLAHAAWLSVHGSGKQQKLAAEFVEYILQRAGEAGEKVYEKAKEIVEEGKARGSLTLKGFEKKVEVDGKTYVVKVIGGEAVEEGRGGRKLLRIKITAEVGGVRSEYTITYSRRGRDNAAEGYAYVRVDAPEVREADAERFSALVEALTGVKPKIRRRSDGTIELVCGREHLEGFKRFAELADAIMKWLKETSR
jgi:hypothetical protein